MATLRPVRPSTRAFVLVAGLVAAAALYGSPGTPAADDGRGPARNPTEMLGESGRAAQDLEAVHLHALGVQQAGDRVTGQREQDGLHAAEAHYNERHAYWDARLTEPELRQALLLDAHESATAYFRLLHEQFLPRVATGDRRATAALLDGPMDGAYRRYGAAIDRVTVLARQLAAATPDAPEPGPPARLALALAGALAVWAIGAGLATLHAFSRPEHREQSLTDRPGTGASASEPREGSERSEATGAEPVGLSASAVWTDDGPRERSDRREEEGRQPVSRSPTLAGDSREDSR
jgi:hypothetical protein